MSNRCVIGDATIYHGDARAVLAALPDQSVQTCVTSPPYWGLRDYGVDGQIGLDATPEEYIETMVAVFREVRRVLRDDGTLWVNIGDSYASSGGAGWQGKHGARANRTHTQRRLLAFAGRKRAATGSGIKYNDSMANAIGDLVDERNKRSVWSIASQPFSGAHFATFPPNLILPCILAGAAPGGVVLDPFHGAGTTGVVALEHGRQYIGIELNADYIDMSVPRLDAVLAQGRLFA